MKNIVAIEQVGGVIITVTNSGGNNYLQFEIPRGYSGRDFDEWWHEHRDEIHILKYLIWVDKVESLTQ